MTIRTLCTVACQMLVFLLPVAPVPASAQTVPGVGFEAIVIPDPVNGGTTPGYVFYPSTQPSQTAWRGSYEMHATPDAPPVAGAKPLVVISHGHGGSNLGHHDLAEYLAGNGFVVATLEHPKDNFHDMSGGGSAAVLVGRSIQVKAAINQLLNDPRWKARINPSQVGVAGFSAGGYAALMVVGAIPNFDLYVGYCHRQPQDRDCGLVRKIEAEGKATEVLTALKASIDRWGKPDTPIVKAAFVMAPLGLVFDKTGLSHVDRPVFLYYGQDDQVLLPQENALHIAPLIKTLTRIEMMPKAGHYVFLSPCSPQLARDMPDICKDPPGVDRVMAHQGINASALEFFRQALGVAAH